jgi:hypothetical protein
MAGRCSSSALVSTSKYATRFCDLYTSMGLGQWFTQHTFFQRLALLIGQVLIGSTSRRTHFIEAVALLVTRLALVAAQTPTTFIPLTTVFTPPAFCNRGVFTIEPTYFTSTTASLIVGGVPTLITTYSLNGAYYGSGASASLPTVGQVNFNWDPACAPVGYFDVWVGFTYDELPKYMYSPGLCPSAYTTCNLAYSDFAIASITLEPSVSIAACCPPGGYTCSYFDATIGCWSSIPTSTTAQVALDTSATVFPTSSAGPGTVEALAVVVLWQSNDFSSDPYPSSTTTPTPTGPMPLTTAFTPPNGCLDTTIYNGDEVYYLGITIPPDPFAGGAHPISSCYPPNFNPTATYSPGICPSGWAIACGAPKQPGNGITAALCCPSGYSCDTALSLADVRFSDCSIPIPATMTNVITETTYVDYNPLLAPAPSPPVNVTNAFWADSCNCIRASAITIEWAATDSAVLAFETLQNGTNFTLPGGKGPISKSTDHAIGISIGIVGFFMIVGIFICTFRSNRRQRSNFEVKSPNNLQRHTYTEGDEKIVATHEVPKQEVVPPLLEATSRSEPPPAVGIPQAELGLYPTPALADSNPLVELGQPAVEPRRSKLPYGWESWNTRGPVEADSSNLAELAQPASAPDVYSPEPQGDFSQSHEPDIHNPSPQPYPTPPNREILARTTEDEELTFLRQEEERIMAERAKLQRLQELDDQAAATRRRIAEREQLLRQS